MMNEGPAVGSTWQGEYLLQATLGDPAHGVFRAQRRRDAQPVVLRFWRAPNDALAREFLEHARAASAVQHPALAQVLATGREGLTCFIVSEFVGGQPLDAWADQVGIPPLGEVIELMRKLCDGLTLAGALSVTHSALHPRNLLMLPTEQASSRRAHPKLLDLGVPQLAQPREPSTLAAQFMAPEQLAPLFEPGRPPLPAATPTMNVYSCGALLYYLCTGGPPYRASGEALRDAQREGKLVVPSRINPQITASMNAVMVQALSVDPKQRFATVADFADALARVTLTPSVAGARPILSTVPPPRTSQPPVISNANTRASAVGRNRTSSPPAISVPKGIGRRPTPAPSLFESEAETAPTGKIPMPPVRQPPAMWAPVTEPRKPTPRDGINAPAGSFSSVPPPRLSPLPKAPAPVVAAPLALFSGAPSVPTEPPIRIDQPPPDSLLTNDAVTARPPRDRQRNPMMWFGVLAALVCGGLFGLVRLLGNPTTPADPTPTVTVDRPMLETPPPAVETRTGAITNDQAPIEPEPFVAPVLPSNEPEQPEHELASANSNSSSRSSNSSRSRSRSNNGSSQTNRDSRTPSPPASVSAPPPEPQPVHAAEPVAPPPSAPAPVEPNFAAQDAAPPLSKVAPRAFDAATPSAGVPPSAAREPSKSQPTAEDIQLPLEAKSAIGDVTIRGPLPTSAVRRAAERVSAQFRACYARAADAAGRNQFGAVTVDLDIDERGRARSPSARGSRLSGLNECVADAAGKVISEAPDTGTVHASFKVIFTP